MALELLTAVIDAGEDFEWYPTTSRMIGEVARRLPRRFDSLMDIGAGDGRVLMSLAKVAENTPELFAIEKSHVLLQAQPESITPVGVDFHEQNLSSLPATFIFSNPPYSEFELWAERIIATGFAERAYLILPRRWKESTAIAAALAKRKATASVIYSDTFEDAPRRARAVVDIVEVRYPLNDHYHRDRKVDPFDQWFDQNISTFDPETPIEEDVPGADMAKVRGLKTIADLVAAYDDDYDRMQEHYRAIFKLDYAILKELGIKKDAVRSGLKQRMAGLKTTYWQLLFEKLDTITSRLSTKTKAKFLDRLTGRTSVAFTYNNAYAIVMWAIRHANRYFDEQVVDLFRQLATFEGVSNYKSNVKTWEKRDGWRYHSEDYSHFALDYRIVVERHSAIFDREFGGYEYPGGLYKGCHELLDDMIAVFSNLGYPLGLTLASRSRTWESGTKQEFWNGDGETLFEVRAFKKGTMHFRIMPEAMKALNVEAGRLLGWLHSPEDVEQELGYSADEARAFFGSNRQLTAGTMKMLTAATTEQESAHE